jgi:hypothetical protein
MAEYLSKFGYSAFFIEQPFYPVFYIEFYSLAYEMNGSTSKSIFSPQSGTLSQPKWHKISKITHNCLFLKVFVSTGSTHRVMSLR